MSELSPSSRELLSAARPGLDPDAARVARGRDRLLAATATAAAGAAVIEAAHATVAAPPPIAPAPAPVATAVVKGAGLGAVKLALVGAAALAVLVAVGWLVAPRSSARAPSAPQTPAVAPPPPAAIGEAPVAAPPSDPVAAIDLDDITLEPSAPARAGVRPRAVEPRVVDAPGAAPVVEVAAPPADPLTRELALLRTARAALRSGDAGASLTSLAAYHREFTDGQLAEEAAALEVEAACAAGRGDVEARRAAFVRRWPTSTARARVERACR